MSFNGGNFRPQFPHGGQYENFPYPFNASGPEFNGGLPTQQGPRPLFNEMTRPLFPGPMFPPHNNNNLGNHQQQHFEYLQQPNNTFPPQVVNQNPLNQFPVNPSFSAASSFQLPPTLSSFISFSTSLNLVNHGLNQNSMYFAQPPHQMIQQQHPTSFPPYNHFRPDISGKRPPTSFAQGVAPISGPFPPSHSGPQYHYHQPPKTSNVLPGTNYLTTTVPRVPPPVPSPFGGTALPQAVPPPVITFPVNSSQPPLQPKVDLYNVSTSKRKHSTDDSDLYDPDKEIERITLLDAKFKPEVYSQRYNFKKDKDELPQPPQPKKLPVWLRQSLENAKDLGKNSKKDDENKKDDSDDEIPEDDDDNEVIKKENFQTKLEDTTEELPSEQPLRLTQKQFDEMVMKHTRTVLTELLLTTTNETIEKTCQKGINKELDVSSSKEQALLSSNLNKSALIASTMAKPSVKNSSSGNSSSSKGSLSRKANEAASCSTSAVSGVQVVSTPTAASKYLAQLSGYYGSSSDDEEESEEKEKSQSKNQEAKKTKPSHSSENGSRKDDSNKEKKDPKKDPKSESSDHYRHSSKESSKGQHGTREKDHRDHHHQSSRHRDHGHGSKGKSSSHSSSSHRRSSDKYHRDSREKSRDYRSHSRTSKS